ncbi:MAG: TIGR00725 family protein [Candidatus Altiarchaeota archaeon]
MRTCIGVIGSDGEIPNKVREAAETVGSDIAKNGCVLVCGGRGGVMEAACRGAKGAGGLTVGILPSADKNDANKYVDIVLPTGMGYARNALVVSSSDAVIAIHGGKGTLSEIALALNYNRPVVLVDGTGGVTDTVDGTLKGISQVNRARPADAVKMAMSQVLNSK